MKRRGISTIVILCAMVVSILTVGLVVSVGVQQDAFDRGVKACSAAIAMRNPKHDVTTDMTRGERRFFFNGFNEWAEGRYAVGAMPEYDLAGRPLRGCFKHEPNAWRELPFATFSSYVRIRKGDPFTGSFDPIHSPRTPCGKARNDYIRAYNAEMARQSPASIARYCDR